jgi:hypothetical protein
MFFRYKYLITIAIISFFNIFLVQSETNVLFNNEDIISTLNTNSKQTFNAKLLNDINKKDSSEFTDEELLNFVSKGLDKIKPFFTNEADPNPNFKKLENIKSFLVKKLKRYKIKGISFSATVDPNFAFLYGNMNPDVGIIYKDDDGNYLLKNYKSSIRSFGSKIEAAFCVDFIFFIDTEFNFYDSKNKIDLGSGFSFNLGLNVTYASIKNSPGAILIIGIPCGIFLPLSLSYVFGGQLQAK